MNLDRIEAILRLMSREPNVGEILLEGDGWKLEATRALRPPAVPLEAPVPAPPREEALPELPHCEILAERVGIYRAPSGGLLRGAHISRGGALGAVDSMRILNPIAAPEAGYVADLRVEDGDPVEYGQLLLVLEPEPPRDE